MVNESRINWAFHSLTTFVPRRKTPGLEKSSSSWGTTGFCADPPCLRLAQTRDQPFVYSAKLQIRQFLWRWRDLSGLKRCGRISLLAVRAVRHSQSKRMLTPVRGRDQNSRKTSRFLISLSSLAFHCSPGIIETSSGEEIDTGKRNNELIRLKTSTLSACAYEANAVRGRAFQLRRLEAKQNRAPQQLNFRPQR